jgi:hypothetical protein
MSYDEARYVTELSRDTLLCKIIGLKLTAFNASHLEYITFKGIPLSGSGDTDGLLCTERVKSNNETEYFDCLELLAT